MCMSTAYEVRDGQENQICDYVREATQNGEEVTLVDLTGNEMVVKGHISRIDLLKNMILIEA